MLDAKMGEAAEGTARIADGGEGREKRARPYTSSVGAYRVGHACLMLLDA